MKKLLLIAVFPIIIGACANDEVISLPEECVKTVENSRIRSLDEVVDIANRAAIEFFQPTSRSDERKASAKNALVITGINGRSIATDTLLYVVNYDDEKGFAVISAPRNCDELLGVIEVGNYGLSDECPAFEYFMESAKVYVQNRMADDVQSRSDGNDMAIEKKGVKIERDTLEYKKIPPHMTTNWGQTNPEGWYCPNGYSGCGATAIAMITANFGEIDVMTYTYEGANPKSEWIPWDDIRYYDGSNYRSHPSKWDNKLKERVARLCREVGEIAGADYSQPDGTGTKRDKYVSTLKYFNPTRIVSDLKNYSKSGIKAGLENGWGHVLMVGDEMNEKKFGHVWVADGLIYLHARNRTYTLEKIGDFTIYNLVEEVIEKRTYFHFNWGWNQLYNGYFSGEVFTPENAYKHDLPDESQNKPSGYSFGNTMYITIR